MSVLDWIIQHHKIDLEDEPPHLLARDRWDYFPALFRKLGFSVGAEIGVEEGRFSQRLCQQVPGLKLYAVDAWKSYGWYTTTKYDQALMDKKYRRAVERLAPFNCEIIRGMSGEVGPRFPDGSLDFVHVDANGGFTYVYDDLALWSQKVRSGGIVSGHDYFNSRQPQRCRGKDAVDQWTRENQIDPWFVIVGGRYPSYFWVKP